MINVCLKMKYEKDCIICFLSYELQTEDFDVLGEHDVNEQQLQSPGTCNGVQENVKNGAPRSSLSIVVPRSSEKVDLQLLMSRSTMSTSLRGLNQDWVNCIAELDNLNMYVLPIYLLWHSPSFL